MNNLNLLNPKHIRAVMARGGISPAWLAAYDDAEQGHVNPLDDPEAQAEVHRFLCQIWHACLIAEHDLLPSLEASR